MQQLTLKVLNFYSEAIEEARRKGYDSHQKLNEYKEEKYDDISYHVVAIVENEVIGTVRLTAYPLSPIADWTNGQAILPHDERTISVTKGFMVPQYRKNGVFKLLFSSALLFCQKHGYNKVIGAYESIVRSKAFTKRLGFEEIDQLLKVSIPPYHNAIIIPIVCDLQKKYGCYLQEFELTMTQLENAGFDVRIQNQIVENLSLSTKTNHGSHCGESLI